MEYLSKQEQWDSKFFRVLNSALCSIIAYLLVLFVCGAAKTYTGTFYDIKSTLYFFDSVPFSDNVATWYLKNVVIVYSSGIIAVVILGLLGLSLFHTLKRFDFPFSLFFLWLYFWASVILCAQGALALLGLEKYESPYYNNLVIVLAWLRVPQLLAYILVPASIALLTLSCYYSIRPFISMAYSYGKVNKLVRRRKYFFEIAGIPFIISALFVTAAIFPEHFTYVNIFYVLYGAISIVISWYLLFFRDVDREGVFKNFKLQKFNLFIAIFFCVVIALVLWKLDGGIKFGE
ncbi:MAG: hypothetical protein M9931_03240 [Chitinophagales bacterium]|nr:hypothetical protein [Chitinophagales bacterium]